MGRHPRTPDIKNYSAGSYPGQNRRPLPMGLAETVGLRHVSISDMPPNGDFQASANCDHARRGRSTKTCGFSTVLHTHSKTSMPTQQESDVPKAGRQRDERKAWMPNYDLFSLRLRRLRRLKYCTRCRLRGRSLGETGSMIVSTPVLPRYKIGDLIRAFQPPDFRCIGRDQWWTPLRYAWESSGRSIRASCERVST